MGVFIWHVCITVLSPNHYSSNFVYNLSRSGHGLRSPSPNRVFLTFREEGGTFYSANSLRWVIKPFRLMSSHAGALTSKRCIQSDSKVLSPNYLLFLSWKIIIVISEIYKEGRNLFLLLLYLQCHSQSPHIIFTGTRFASFITCWPWYLKDTLRDVGNVGKIPAGSTPSETTQGLFLFSVALLIKYIQMPVFRV